MTILSLQSETPPGFARWFEAHIEEMLLDHAHCEKKAASTAMNFIFRYTDKPALLDTMSEIIEEEMLHFRQVLGLLRARGLELERRTPSNYAPTLYKQCRKPEPESFIDRMLISALIEARSCERFAVLGRELADAELAAFYRSLFESEARHYTHYLKLALEAGDERDVRERLRFLAEHEAEIAATPGAEPRLHSGPPDAFAS